VTINLLALHGWSDATLLPLGFTPVEAWAQVLVAVDELNPLDGRHGVEYATALAIL
jgi:hypothetical protein